jgi:aspartyl-tRNA(Asn)/glutamyl-tRNA(Gln) amidotransferase subunit A
VLRNGSYRKAVGRGYATSSETARLRSSELRAVLAAVDYLTGQQPTKRSAAASDLLRSVFDDSASVIASELSEQTRSVSSSKLEELNFQGTHHPVTPGPAGDACELTISEATGRIERKTLSPVELTLSMLDRISTNDARIRAWFTVAADQALEAARAAESRALAGARRGILDGIPYGLKDVFLTAGIRTTFGSRTASTFIPSRNAAVVSRLNEAGAVLLGKTSTTEYAIGDPVASRNPWDLGHTPGASSAGSAAAVAASMATFSIGTQAGGSLLRPAAYCGVVGLKPTSGLISRRGLVPVSWTLDEVGTVSRTVADAAILLGTLGRRKHGGGNESDDYYMRFLGQSVAGVRVGIPDRFFTSQASREVRAAYDRALNVLESLGTHLIEITLPTIFERAQSTLAILSYAEAASLHLNTYRAHRPVLGARMRRNIEVGTLIPAAAYLEALRVRDQYKRQMTSVMASVDVIATPSAPTPAPRGLRNPGSPILNYPFTLAGLPTITIPIGFSRSLLPIGMQVVAQRHSESALFTVGNAYQMATDWHTKRPTLALQDREGSHDAISGSVAEAPRG